VWSSTSGAPRQSAGPKPSGAPSQAAPQSKRRISRWLQVGGVAASVALAAGLFALRARDAAPQGSLITAVPETVATQEIPPPTAAPETLDALQKHAPQPQTAAPSNATSPPAQAAKAEPTAKAEPAAKASPPKPAIEAAAPQASPQSAAAAATQAAKPEPAPKALGSEPAQKSASSAAAAQPTAAESIKPAQPSQLSADAQASLSQALSKGKNLEQKGKIQDALALYTKAIEGGAASSQLLSHMAFLYLNQGKNALAEIHAKRATDADETNSEGWIVLGAARDQLGKKPAAEQAYRNCASKGQGQYVTECHRMLH
jgi:tetratricopeptide (TPR) repeat protein